MNGLSFVTVEWLETQEITIADLINKVSDSQKLRDLSEKFKTLTNSVINEKKSHAVSDFFFENGVVEKV